MHAKIKDSAEKKSIVTEKDFERQWITKKRATTFEVVVVGNTCGQTFELVRFHGAGAVCGNGCGYGLRAGKILPAQRGLS